MEVVRAANSGSMPDLLTLASLDNVGAADRARSASQARVRYDDGTELIQNDFSSRTGWTGEDDAKMDFTNNVFFSGWDSGEGTPSLYQAFAVASGKTLRLSGRITVAGTPGTNQALFTGLFITSDTTPSSSSYSNTIGVGVNELNQPCIWPAFGTSSAAAAQSSSALPAGTYTAVIEIDANRISLALTSDDGTVNYLLHAPRTNLAGSAVKNVQLINRDSRKTLGNSILKLLAKTEAATARSRATVTAEGHRELVYTYPTSTSTDNLRVCVPATYDSRYQTPLVMFAHGSGRSAAVPGNSNTDTLVETLDSYGYLVAAGDFGLDGWGNDAAINAFTDAYRYMRDRFNIGPLLLLSASMGGLTALNVLARRVIPGVIGWYGMYPVTNLAYQYANNATEAPAIETAYGFSGAANYAAATSGHDPMLRKGWEFRGVRMRMSASPDDTTVLKADNADLFSALVAGWAPESGVLVGSGVHGAASQTDIADVTSFFNRCLNLSS